MDIVTNPIYLILEMVLKIGTYLPIRSCFPLYISRNYMEDVREEKLIPDIKNSKKSDLVEDRLM